MNPLTAYMAYRQVMRSQWLTAAERRAQQDAKLRRLVRHAYETVPFYRARMQHAGVKPDDIRSQDDLSKLTPINRADIQAAGYDSFLSSLYRPKALTAEHTSGSSGQPLTTYFDARFVAVRNALFLRALMAAGYRVGKKVMLLTNTASKRPKPWLRWRYVSICEKAEDLFKEFNHYRPDILYGCMTSLRQLANYCATRRMVCHSPQAVISTAEGLDSATRILLYDVFKADVYDSYGMTEMGMVAWECPAHDGYHVSEDSVIVEFVADQACDGTRMIMTNLDLYGMPLIRYMTGDLAITGSAEACVCGRTLRRIDRIEGRVLDSITRADGHTLSPYRFTLAIEKILDIGRYQLVQLAAGEFLLRVEGEADGREGLADTAHKVISDAIGEDIRLHLSFEQCLDPPAGRTYRVVENRVTV